MDEVKINILRDVFLNVSANSDSAEEYIENKLKEICSQEKVSAEEIICFFI